MRDCNCEKNEMVNSAKSVVSKENWQKYGAFVVVVDVADSRKYRQLWYNFTSFG